MVGRSFALIRRLRQLGYGFARNVEMTPKRSFVGKPQDTSEERQAVALEFIAHYLERIDSHHELLGKTVADVVGNEKLRLQLQSFEKTVKDVLSRR